MDVALYRKDEHLLHFGEKRNCDQQSPSLLFALQLKCINPLKQAFKNISSSRARSLAQINLKSENFVASFIFINFCDINPNPGYNSLN